MNAQLEVLLAWLKDRGGILWEPGREGEVGWAICPCCGKRELRLEIKRDAA
jgi:hypothetical protein